MCRTACRSWHLVGRRHRAGHQCFKRRLLPDGLWPRRSRIKAEDRLALNDPFPDIAGPHLADCRSHSSSPKSRHARAVIGADERNPRDPVAARQPAPSDRSSRRRGERLLPTEAFVGAVGRGLIPAPRCGRAAGGESSSPPAAAFGLARRHGFLVASAEQWRMGHPSRSGWTTRGSDWIAAPSWRSRNEHCLTRCLVLRGERGVRLAADAHRFASLSGSSSTRVISSSRWPVSRSRSPGGRAGSASAESVWWCMSDSIANSMWSRPG